MDKIQYYVTITVGKISSARPRDAFDASEVLIECDLKYPLDYEYDENNPLIRHSVTILDDKVLMQLYPRDFSLAIKGTISHLKDKRQVVLNRLLDSPAKGESAGYPTQLSDANSFNTEGDNTDSTVLMRIDARLKIDETREEWTNKVLKIKSLYYSYCDAQATGVVRRVLHAIESITLSEDWEKTLASVLVAAKKDKDNALASAKSYLQSLE